MDDDMLRSLEAFSARYLWLLRRNVGGRWRNSLHLSVRHHLFTNLPQDKGTESGLGNRSRLHVLRTILGKQNRRKRDIRVKVPNHLCLRAYWLTRISAER